MKRLGQWRRLAVISWTLVHHGLDEVVLAAHLLRPVRWAAYLLPWRWRRRRLGSRGERIRRALEDLGPIFIKFGQLLSTRADLLPPDMVEQLAYLQDQVPPFPGEQAVAIVEQHLGSKVTERFRSFDIEPLASASIAQVHAAVLNDGRDVVVKVVRPGIRKTIGRDIGLLYMIARLAERYWEDGRRLHPVDVVAEFERTLYDELDLTREGANATQLRRNFQDSAELYVPEVHWEYTRGAVITMERVHGVPISDIDALRRRGVDLQVLSERGARIFFTQVFRDSFFHADMHPGNIFVDVADPQNPRYIAVDFGIMGSLSPVDQHYLASNMLAFFNRDYRRVAELHVESGWVPKGTRVDEFEAAIRTVSEPIFGRALADISFGHFLLRLFQTARRFNMEVQPQLVLLQKTLLSVEGLGRRLYPALDLWTTAKPLMERWMSEQVGARALVQQLKHEAPQWASSLPAMPRLTAELLQKATQGQLELTQRSPQWDALHQDLRRFARRGLRTLVGAALLLCAVLIWGLGGDALAQVYDIPVAAWIMGLLGGGLLAGVLLGD